MGMHGRGNVLCELDDLGNPIDLTIESNSFGTQLYANHGSKIMSYSGTKTEILIALNAMKNLLIEINYQNRKY